jgi:SAM-dependent methyltransferase
MSQYSPFNPNPLYCFLNPMYSIRRGLFLLIKEFAPNLKGRILDFGCGSKPYRDLFAVERYVGIDIAVSGHNHRESSVDVFYDGKTIPFDDAYFDGVFSSEVFEHVFNIHEILTELNRVTVLGGKLLITIPFAWPEHEEPYDFARYTIFGISHILQESGFKINAQRKNGHYSEVILQQFLLFLLLHCNPKNKILKVLSRVLLFAPVYVIGKILSFLLPRDERYYHNLVIMAEKVSTLKKNEQA